METPPLPDVMRIPFLLLDGVFVCNPSTLPTRDCCRRKMVNNNNKAIQEKSFIYPPQGEQHQQSNPSPELPLNTL